MAPIALLSVSDKTDLVPFAKALNENHGYELLSSGGTAKVLEEAGIEVTRVSNYTKAPEILDGRVKTLHPRIHGGILAKRDSTSHAIDLEKHKISHIDIVVVNLYPFKETVSDAQVSKEKAIENIDIGGPAMIRAAAKNHKFVSVLTHPSQYTKFLSSLERGLTQGVRDQLALEAFEHTTAYDATISRWLGEKINSEASPFIEVIPIKQKLRYGENPHQSAIWFGSEHEGWGNATQLQGKELSTNNLLDLEAAFSTVYEFGYGSKASRPANKPAAVVVKHTNPCGIAIGDRLSEALKRALDGDRTSAFGGIVALNKQIDELTAIELKSLFLECVVAPSFTKEALEILSSKKNLRLIELSDSALFSKKRINIRSIFGGIIVQEQDDLLINQNNWKVVTSTKPTLQEKEDLIFAWKAVRHVHSNAILIAKAGKSLGIGAGQMNRIGAANIALDAAGKQSIGAVLASDGFFPFDDTVQLAKEKGIKSIIQPGGSIRDKDSIAACEEAGISMLFTGTRHFLH